MLPCFTQGNSCLQIRNSGFLVVNKFDLRHPSSRKAMLCQAEYLKVKFLQDNPELG